MQEVSRDDEQLLAKIKDEKGTTYRLHRWYAYLTLVAMVGVLRVRKHQHHPYELSGFASQRTQGLLVGKLPQLLHGPSFDQSFLLCHPQLVVVWLERFVLTLRFVGIGVFLL